MSLSLERVAARVTRWSERWYPDSYVFAALATVAVALGALAIGATPAAVSGAFGDGYWSLIPFTMQMAMVSISGYVVATSRPSARLIEALARVPRTPRGAVAFVAGATMVASLLNWAFSLAFGGLLVRGLARRRELRMDYRAAGASAYLGLGATWALGLSSSAAQLQANAASIPKALLPITGVIPFSETIFLPQSMLLLAVIAALSVVVAYLAAPAEDRAVTAEELGIPVEEPRVPVTRPSRPAEWLEHSPALTLAIGGLGALWLAREFRAAGAGNAWLAISNLNTYNLLFLVLGMFLHWRPRSFLASVTRAVPTVSGVLIQFPLYGSIAYLLTQAANAEGHTLAHLIAKFFVSVSSTESFPAVMAAYSAVLGFFVPSGGGKWVVEAPYVMQAANDLRVHLGWTVTIYNAAEALPNLINPFWMLPLLGVLGLKARDLIGYTFTQFLLHVPVVILLLWSLAKTLTYHPPAL